MATLHATLTHNYANNYVIVGNVLTDTGVILKVIARRGSLCCSGMIDVLSPFTDYVNPTPTVKIEPSSGVGWTVTADSNGSGQE
jgi:hypothetical protein